MGGRQSELTSPSRHAEKFEGLQNPWDDIDDLSSEADADNWLDHDSGQGAAWNDAGGSDDGDFGTDDGTEWNSGDGSYSGDSPAALPPRRKVVKKSPLRNLCLLLRRIAKLHRWTPNSTKRSLLQSSFWCWALRSIHCPIVSLRPEWQGSFRSRTPATNAAAMPFTSAASSCRGFLCAQVAITLVASTTRICHHFGCAV